MTVKRFSQFVRSSKKFLYSVIIFICWMPTLNKFLPSSQKYLTKHYLDLIILKSIMLEQHYGDLTSPFVSAYTHSDGEKYGLLNPIISDTDFNDFKMFQRKTGWIHLNPSYLKYVTRVGYVDFSKPLMYNKVAIMSFTPHKEGILFDRGVLISGSRDYIRSFSRQSKTS